MQIYKELSRIYLLEDDYIKSKYYNDRLEQYGLEPKTSILRQTSNE